MFFIHDREPSPYKSGQQYIALINMLQIALDDGFSRYPSSSIHDAIQENIAGTLQWNTLKITLTCARWGVASTKVLNPSGVFS